MLFTWDDTYRTGIEEVDNQHMELFETANNLHLAANKDNNNHLVKETIEFLCKYVSNHFYIEESYQQKYNYPQYEQHKAMHTSFTEELTRLKNEVLTNASAKNVEKLSIFVIDWLKEHILKTDKEMGIYVVNSAGPDL